MARYGQLFPQAVRQVEHLSEAARTAAVDRWRVRLADLSCFMRCVNEWIARQANAEDECTGRFWEGRFRSQAVLYEGALLTCMTYVDLNPVRAAVAGRIEDCDWTSIQARLLAAARTPTAVPPGLVPFADQAAGNGVSVPLAFTDYVEVLRWTVTALTAGNEVVPEPAGVATTLVGRGLAPAGFVDGVRTFARTFFTMVGHVHRIDLEHASSRQLRRHIVPRTPGCDSCADFC